MYESSEDAPRQVGFSGHWDRLGFGLLLPLVGHMVDLDIVCMIFGISCNLCKITYYMVLPCR